MVFYSVRAQYIEEKLGEFYQKLTNGVIANQKPDGQEIVESMKRAKITGPKTIQWSEVCFCPTPLKHERQTVYDHFLTNFQTQIVDNYTKLNGKSFFEFLEKEHAIK